MPPRRSARAQFLLSADGPHDVGLCFRVKLLIQFPQDDPGFEIRSFYGLPRQIFRNQIKTGQANAARHHYY
jgi:hypothetical protein